MANRGLTPVLTLCLIVVAFAPFTLTLSVGQIIEEDTIRQDVKDGLIKINCEKFEPDVTDCVLKLGTAMNKGYLKRTDCESLIVEMVDKCFKDGLFECRNVSPQDLSNASGEIKKRLRNRCLAILGITIVAIIAIVIGVILLISIICCIACCLCRNRKR